MSQYILRLDDASEHMDVDKWEKMEDLLDQYHIKPMVGIIPDNRDPALVSTYECDPAFWERAERWKNKGWTLALHGCTHQYITQEAGINPINARSEFAGVPLKAQCEKIRRGVEILKEHNIVPEIFFAPSHTYDFNTLLALQRESEIRIISDTIASDVYCQYGFYFIPQQSGKVRRLPLKVVTFCYHPNTMTEETFSGLRDFLSTNAQRFVCAANLPMKRRKLSPADRLLRTIYFAKRR